VSHLVLLGPPLTPLQTLGALALALATNQSQYYAEAYNHYQTYSLAQDESFVLNWDDKTPAVFELFVEIALARPQLAEQASLTQNTTGWKTQMEGYLDKIVDGTSRGYLTKGESSCLAPLLC
jgi:endoglucanase